MTEVLWRLWCLWWVCLAAQTVARVEPTAAGGQGQCVVLDLSLPSPTYYSLPTNLTVRPTTDPEWMLDFALQEGEAPPAACVRIELEQSMVRLLLYEGVCKDGMLMDYHYMNNQGSVLPHAWTSFGVDVKDNTVLVKGPADDPIPLMTDTSSLPFDTLYVTAAKDVEVAVGCRVNCPHYKLSSKQNKKKNIMKSSQDNVLFYFRPGNEFVKLEYEVTCTTPLGHEVFPHIADIVPPEHLPRGLWHLVEVKHLGGVAEVRLDYKFLKEEKLSHGCAFTEHTIRIEGESLFSFSCNPSSGVMEWVDDGVRQCHSSTHSSFSVPNHYIVGSLLVLVYTMLVLSVYGVVKLVCQQHASRVRQGGGQPIA